MAYCEPCLSTRIKVGNATSGNGQSPRLFRALRDILPADGLLVSDGERRPYECDGLTGYRELPLAVAIPDQLDQVEQILSLCDSQGVPVIARGAGTGLSGGATPRRDALLLSMARFSRIIDVDPVGRTARVEPGVRNLAISEAAAPYGLYYAPDPSSQIACTIGGNVAENSGGVHCLKYGLTVHNIIRLDVVLIDGEKITVGSEALDSPGYDLLALMTGSEGMLGVVTAITVRLLPIPVAAKTILAGFNDVEKAADSVAKLIAAGVIPAGLEMMDNPAIRAAEDFSEAGYPRDAGLNYRARTAAFLVGSQECISCGWTNISRLLLY